MKTPANGPSGRWWGKCALAGVIGGAAMGMYEMMAMWFMGMGFWMPMNMIGATVPAFRPPAPEFVLGPSMTGMVLHMMTSAFWGVLFGVAIAAIGTRLARSWGGELALGLGWGVVAWAVMGKLIGPLLNPVIAMADPVHFFIGHIVYGVVTALALYAMARRAELVSVTFAPGVGATEREQTPTNRR